MRASNTPEPAPKPAAVSTSDHAQHRPKNRLLAKLPEAEFARLKPHLRTIDARLKQTLFRAGDAIEYVYFPNGGVCSVATILPDGASVEATMIGAEGIVGIEAFFSSAPISPGENLVQIPNCSMERLGLETFRREIEGRGTLTTLVGAYAEVVLAVLMQASACNARHPVNERCAKWLLTAQDRLAQRPEFRLSHEFLAMMVGATRPTVTAIAQRFQHAGLIRYSYGRMTIVDRRGLERTACSCYPVIRAQFERLE
jgi:CRP-like cAMP-binding protein